MTISFYDASVGCFRQVVGAVGGILDKGMAHCRAHGLDLEAVADSSFASDMFNFRRQIHFVSHFSAGTIQALRRGVFEPPYDIPHLHYAGLQTLIADTHATLSALVPAEVEALAGRDILFKGRGMELPFTAEGFVLSFALPNLYFHATTAYDLLRMQGVALGKRDFIGTPRLKH